MRKLFSKTTAGWILIAFGGFLAIGALGNAAERGWDAGDAALWWVLVALPIGAGIALIGFTYLAGLQRQQAAFDDAVIHAALAHGGALTAADLAAATDLTLDQADEALRQLARDSHVSPSLTDDGVMLYRLATAGSPSATRKRPTKPKQARAGTGAILSGVQIARRRRVASILTWGLLAVLVAASIVLTVTGPGLWPAG